MSVTRMVFLLGILCSAWMTSPVTANAYEEFVGLSDRGRTTVMDCGNGNGKGATYLFGGALLNAGLKIDLNGGDGLYNDRFDAFYCYGTACDPSQNHLFKGIWSKTSDRNGIQTYQLIPSGDLTELTASLPTSGWGELLAVIKVEAGDTCAKAPPGFVYPALSVLVKGTLKVNTNIRDQIPCPAPAGSCSKADVELDLKAVMGYADDGWGDPKTDTVKFKFKAKGYVLP